MSRDDLVSRAKYRNEIEKAIQGKSSSWVNVEMMVDQKLTRNEIQQISVPLKKLESACPVLNNNASDPHDNHIEEIKERGKVKIAIVNHWGKIVISIVGMILAFLGGSVMGGV